MILVNLLTALPSGYYKEIEVSNDSGNFVKKRRINTFPHSSFLEEVLKNYKYEDFNSERVYNLMFSELFTDNFYNNRDFIKFFRVRGYYNDNLFRFLYRGCLPLFTKAKTVGIVKAILPPNQLRNSENIVWLELGNDEVGLEHIWKRHFMDQFENWGILNPTQLAELLLYTISTQNPYKIDDRNDRYSYEIKYKGINRKIMIIISKNGFIINAWPETS